MTHIAFFAEKSARISILATGETSQAAIAEAIKCLGAEHVSEDDLDAMPVTPRFAAALASGEAIDKWTENAGFADLVDRELTEAMVSAALANGIHMDVYLLFDHSNGELCIEHMPAGIAANWREDIEELVFIPGWEVSKIARMKQNARRVMRERLEDY